jgi:PAS domain S-box-containing protein
VFVAVTAILLYFERRHADRRCHHLAGVVDSTNAAVIGATPEGIITSWNRGARELYGYSAEEANGRPTSMLIPPERHDDFAIILDKVKSGTPINNYETVRLRKDGTKVPVSLIVSPIRSTTGQVTGMSAIAHDITEFKRAHRALQMAEVGQLASGLVHEIRNPLNAMRMQIAVIQDSLDDPNEIDLAKTQLQKLENEVLRVRRLANDFLAYGRPARNKPERIDLLVLITSVVDFLRPEFARGGTQISVEIRGGADGLTVYMDRDQLRQILANLAENSRQAMAGGGMLTITCDCPTQNRLRIQMRDTGCGISPEKLPRIFDAFYSTKDDGTGLGLAFVKKIVEAAGGTVYADSEVGRGTCIEIRLPIADQADRSDVSRAATTLNKEAR